MCAIDLDVTCIAGCLVKCFGSDSTVGVLGYNYHKHLQKHDRNVRIMKSLMRYKCIP
jgi:hypothetical protein